MKMLLLLVAASLQLSCIAAFRLSYPESIYRKSIFTKQCNRLVVYNTPINNTYTSAIASNGDGSKAFPRIRSLYTVSYILSLGLMIQHLIVHRFNSVQLPIEYATLAVACFIIKDAAKRGRSESNTFKLINIGVLAGVLSSTNVIKMSNAFKNACVSDTMLALHKALLFISSIFYAKKFHLPSVTIRIQGFSKLAISYVIASIWSFFAAIVNISKSTASSTSLLLPIILFALSNAAAAGQKRLSSPAYMRLNIAILANYIANVSVIMSQGTTAFNLNSCGSILSILASLIGLIQGASYSSSSSNSNNSSSSSKDSVFAKEEETKKDM